MESTVRISATATVTSESDLLKGSAAVSYTAYSSSYFTNLQKIGTSYGAINFQGVTNARILYIQNASTASIEISLHPASQSFSVLRAGDPGILTPSSSYVSYYAKATAANAELKVLVSDL